MSGMGSQSLISFSGATCMGIRAGAWDQAEWGEVVMQSHQEAWEARVDGSPGEKPGFIQGEGGKPSAR